jgi:hypothetical protein
MDRKMLMVRWRRKGFAVRESGGAGGGGAEIARRKEGEGDGRKKQIERKRIARRKEGEGDWRKEIERKRIVFFA